MTRSQGGKKRKLVRTLIISALILLVGLPVALVTLPVILPASIGVEVTDYLREIFGPQPVAVLESVSFKMQDVIKRELYKGSAPRIGWNNQDQANVSLQGKSTQTESIKVSAKPAPGFNQVVTASPQIGWQAYGPTVNGENVMARALINIDPQRSYTAVALVRIDLSQLQLHAMPGYLEPSHSSQVVQAIPNLGMIPASDQGRLVAAFNGGFKTIHGHFGMMVDGLTLVPPKPNLATVAIYRDGHVQIGDWGKDIFPSSDMIAFRQNCPPLIDAGQINPELASNNRMAWGYTNNNDITWRTGLGITQDGRYLIYAVGNGTSAETLAQALKDAGAYAAMQLDINQFYAHFYTYQPVDGISSSNGFRYVGERLLDKMINNPHLYLTPNPRDFFYLTAG